MNGAVFLLNTSSHALSVATASAAAIQERASNLFIINDFKSCMYQQHILLLLIRVCYDTGTVGGSTPWSSALSTTGGMFPDIATSGTRCGGIIDWYTRISESLEVYDSL
ncbi:uncharacterized protein EAF02_004474 [Botrytis sinoallii]|uniref:uncharacterized protein n=1 Tax=Botrytis sinoallii TaxID=1463999 RepID=UPI0018FFE481|nr:uncharacterized protein EAF02_004474 [Botrytis sinoallii]KAF7885965.1 hypothetical protein EAF02_004474 [Botrytis sinoallii]